MVSITCIATVIVMTKKAGGSGDIWNQKYEVNGAMRSWLILSSLSSITGGWATMATNIPDFTRYLKREQGVYWQVLFLPLIQLCLGLFGIVSCSAAKVVYGEYVWDPLDLASRWDGPSGRAGAFFVGFAWVVAQIGTNLSANVISFANDLTSLFPKYINIRRGVIICTLTASWIMVPWKIIHSAASLLAFMAGLGIFLAPIAALIGADYWVVKRTHYDVPALYKKHSRYRYNNAGVNWRAVVAFLISVVPNLPGMAHSVNAKINPGGAVYVYDMFYIWGFTSAFVSYVVLNKFFPAPETLIPETIHPDVEYTPGGIVESEEAPSDGAGSEVGDEKKVAKSTDYAV